MIWLRSADPSMVAALEAARVGFSILGCIASGWVVGFGMGYRRGVRDGIAGEPGPSPIPSLPDPADRYRRNRNRASAEGVSTLSPSIMRTISEPD